MTYLSKLAFAAAALTLVAGTCEAHPRLLAVSPSKDSAVSAPKLIQLSFSETLIPRYSRVTLTDSRGGAIKLGPPKAGANLKQVQAATTGPLKPGGYTVNWVAVSTDTHRVQGGYHFTVR